jgi:hypothetical protein
MRNNYNIIYFIILIGLWNKADSQNFIWAKQMGGTDEDAGNAVAWMQSGMYILRDTLKVLPTLTREPERLP